VLAQQELKTTGWELIDWFPRPSKGRHSGLARLYIEEEEIDEVADSKKSYNDNVMDVIIK
jgi:hypothetical protein